MISICIPVKNGGADLERCLAGIRAQRTDREVELVVVDSGSTDGSLDVARSHGAQVVEIAPEAFDHGAARNLAARHAHGDVLVFISQDAFPEREDWLATLTAPLSNGVAGVYGRQLAHADARPPEVYFLDFLYGPDSRTQSAAGEADVSMDTTLFSNVNAAIPRTVWERYPFAEDMIMSEDQEWSRRVLLDGHALRYEAGAAVRHSHDYTLSQAFRRFFDSGVSASRAYMGGDASGGVLRRRALDYARGELAWLARSGNLAWLPYTVAYESAKFLGLQLGMRHERLPRALRPRLSALQNHWARPADGGDACRNCGTVLGEVVLSGRDRLLGEPGEFDVRECAKCGLAATVPRLEGEALGRYYPERYQPYRAPGGPVAALMGRLRVAQMDLRVRREPFATLFEGNERGRVLDVGCGRGDLAAAFIRRGWTAAGLEPSDGAVEEARTMGVDARVGTLADGELWPDESFDAIVFFQSLEHVPDPREDLEAARRMLKPGGRLVVVVPDWGSRQRRIFGSAWYHLDLPRHLHHFSARSLSDVAHRAGLEGVHVRSATSLAGLLASVQYAIFGRCMFRGAALWPALCVVMALYPLTWLATRVAGGDWLSMDAERGGDDHPPR